MYQSDLNDKQWEIVKPYLERSDPRGAVNLHPKRSIINAILYVIRSGIQWRLLPKDFPPWQTVYNHFYRLKNRGVWDQILIDLTKKYRLKAGRNENPSYGIIDSQSVKTQNRGESKGFDGGKKNKRKKTTCVHGYHGKFIIRKSPFSRAS